MVDERPQLWTPWAASQRAVDIEFSSVSVRKWRDRLSAARIRPCVKPAFAVETITDSFWSTITDPSPVYIGTPGYAQYLIARCQMKVNAASDEQTQAGFRVNVGTNIGTEIYLNLNPSYLPPPAVSLFDGNVLDNDDITWFDVTSIIPNPVNGPFIGADIGNVSRILEIQGYCVANCIDVEIRTDHREWTWITEDYLPTIPPFWIPSEYS
jgi:hypothetical protein